MHKDWIPNDANYAIEQSIVVSIAAHESFSSLCEDPTKLAKWLGGRCGTIEYEQMQETVANKTYDFAMKSFENKQAAPLN